jgi:hypothetical protein
MNPLVIAGTGRERIDARLIDRNPIGHAKFLANSFTQAGKGEVPHVFSSSIRIDCADRYMLPYRSRSTFLLIFPTLVFGMLSMKRIFSGIPYFEMMPLSANTLR